MTPSEYQTFAGALAREAGVEKGLHGYFLTHQDRLWTTASHFDLWQARDWKILEIGPFFSYTPFVLRKQGNEVDVLEGEDPAVYPLRSLYQAQGIHFSTCDLAEIFGSLEAGKRALPFPTGQFDLVSCWENMEHFNFNPVGFVRELYRVLKPGGLAYITVPNHAKLENRLKLFFGGSIGTSIDAYNQYSDYANGRFMGFHWREYVLSELVRLFGAHGFQVVSAKHLSTSQNHQSLPASIKLRRLLLKPVNLLAPSTGNLCAIIVRKPVQNNP